MGYEEYPDDFDDDFEDDPCDEPVGSCDECGTNLYGDEFFTGLCGQCEWHLSQGLRDRRDEQEFTQ